MNKVIAVTLLGMMVVGTTQAGPLIQADISTDAKWIFHFDWDAYSTTEMHKLMRDTPARAKAEANIAATTAMLGFNPLEDIDSVTAYGTDFTRGNGVVIIKGNLDPRQATSMLEKNKSHASEPYGAYTIHTWAGKRGRHGKEGACAFYNDGTAILGKTAATVKAAIDVLDANAPSLQADRGEIVIPEVSRDVFMTVYAGKFDSKAGQPPKAQIFRNLDSLTLAAAETDGIMIVEAEMATDNADKAILINNAIAGMLSFAMLGSSENPAMAEMVNALKINTDGQLVKISFSKDSSTLLGVVMQQMEARRQQWQASQDKQSPADQ